MKSLSHARLFATPWIVACTKLLRPWDFQAKSTGVGCRFLLQGIFPTQGSNPGLSHCRQTLYCLSHQGSPTRMNEYPFISMKSLSRAQLSATPWIVACTKLLCPWDFQDKSTGVGCHFLLQLICRVHHVKCQAG